MGISTQMVKVPGPKGEFDAYLAAPQGGQSPGVVVIQEIFGINPHIRSVTDRFAEAGYAAIAPDLYWPHKHHFETGYTPADIEVAGGVMGKISLDDAVKDVAATIGVLKGRKEAKPDKVGVVGFCWGGLMTYLVAARLHPTCSAPYYGGRIAQFLGEAGNINTPAMFHFGEQDASIPMDQVAQIKETFKNNKNVTIYTYPGAQHGFTCDERGSYHEASAELAWGRTLEFLGKHLA